jgi:hypothetical protein
MILYLIILKPLDDLLSSKYVAVKHNLNKINTDNLIPFILSSFIFNAKKMFA